MTFNWIDPNQGNGTQVGFIAQQVQQIFPQLVSTTSPTALTPNGTLGLNYIGLISPIVSAIQALYADIEDIDQTLAAFAQKITSQEADVQKLCVTDSANDPSPVCVTKSQLASLLAGNGSAGNQSPSAPQQNQSAATSTPESVTQNSTNSASTTPDTASQNDAGSEQATTSPDTTDAPSIVPTQDASTTATSTTQ